MILVMRARLSAGIGVVDVQNCVVLRFLAVRARPPAKIGVVEVQKLEWLLWRFLLCARNALRGSCVSDSSRYGSVRIFPVRAQPCAEIVRVRSLPPWPRVNLRISSRSARGRLQGSGCKVATFMYKSSTQSTAPRRGPVPAARAAKS